MILPKRKLHETLKQISDAVKGYKDLNDWRVGQFVSNIAYGEDPFHLSDDVLLKRIKDYYERYKTKRRRTDKTVISKNKVIRRRVRS